MVVSAKLLIDCSNFKDGEIVFEVNCPWKKGDSDDELYSTHIFGDYHRHRSISIGDWPANFTPDRTGFSAL